MISILCIGPESLGYSSPYSVTYTGSYEEAKTLIEYAEAKGEMFEHITVPKRPLPFALTGRSGVLERDRERDPEFWDLLDWLEKRGKRYAIAVYGITDTEQFILLRDHCRRRGFIFLD